MLHPELGLHAELGSLFDDEWLAFQGFDGSRRGQVDGDVWAAFDFEGKGFDYAAASVTGGDGEGGACGEAEGGFPAVEGFIFLVWGRGQWSGTLEREQDRCN